MKGFINFESIWRRSLKAIGQYNKWLFWRQKKFPTAKMRQMKELYRQFVKEGFLCFDIGANMGSRVSTFLMFKARVLAVEPQRQCYEELRKVFKNEEVLIVEKGVGAKNEIRDFFVADNSLISSFSKEWIDNMQDKYFQKNKWDKVEQIEIVTLDMLIEQYGVPDFLKIDTEGFELEVLKGLSTPVKSLSFEYTLPESNHKTLQCIELLEKLYNGQLVFNICRDEAYQLYFENWVSAGDIKELIMGDNFTNKNFGTYGDIYAKVITA